jgi:hypothetical protein
VKEAQRRWNVSPTETVVAIRRSCSTKVCAGDEAGPTLTVSLLLASVYPNVPCVVEIVMRMGLRRRTPN